MEKLHARRLHAAINYFLPIVRPLNGIVAGGTLKHQVVGDFCSSFQVE